MRFNLRNIFRSPCPALVIALFGLTFGPADAQSKMEATVNAPGYQNQSLTFSLPTAGDDALEAALTNKVLHHHEKFDLELSHKIQSLTSTWYHYQLKFNNKPVVLNYLRARVFANSNRVRVDYSSFPRREGTVPPTTLASLSGMQGKKILEQQQVYIAQSGKLQPGLEIVVEESNSRHFRDLYLNGELLYRENLNKYHHSANKDTTIEVSVFNPDPLTTAQKNYVPPYVDSNDGFVQELQDEVVKKNTLGTYESGTFKLKNDFVIIEDRDSPAYVIENSAQGKFNFSRDETGFEQANTLYHATTLKQHINGLGYPNLPGYTLPMDPHALSGSDNSLFSTFNKHILLGEGGVDDAEDADVIVHEFTHAVFWTASPNTGNTTERSTLEEGLADYIAASYSDELSSYNNREVFNWDGHNSFWSGRRVSSTKNYSAISFGFNIYEHTDLISAPLLDIALTIGRDKTDQLVIESSFGLLPSTEYDQFACLMLTADSLLNNHANVTTMESIFDTYGIDACSNGVGIDQPALASESIQLLNSRAFANGGRAVIDADEARSLEVAITNAMGKLIRKKTEDGNQMEISSADLTPGLYLIKVKTGRGTTRVFKTLRAQ